MVFLDRTVLDLSWSTLAIQKSLSAFRDVDIIINAAAYTAVDNAEGDQETAFSVNEVAVSTIANYCKGHTKVLVHISTDYVFNGQSRKPYHPDDTADPLGVYGISKYRGEQAIISSGCSYVILRTSWVYDADGKNFMTTMLRLAKDRDELRVVGDQMGRPTYALDLAQACINAALRLHENPSQYQGIYHVSGTGEVVSWADFAREIFQLSRSYLNKDVMVKDITTAEYPTKATRPAYSALNTNSFEQLFKMQLPNWKLSLKSAIIRYFETL